MATIAKTDMDSNLLTLGLLLGLLNEKPEVAINADWFNDPVDGIKKLGSEGYEQLFDLIGQIFEKDETKNGQAEGENWHAISYPVDQNTGEVKKTPLYLVRKMEKTGAGVVTKDLMGLGFKGEHGASVVVRPYLFIPVAEKGDFVFGRSEYPIEAGVEIRSSEGFKTESISFSGLKVAVKFYFDRAPEISDIMLSGLSLAKGITLPGFDNQTEVGLINCSGGLPARLRNG